MLTQPDPGPDENFEQKPKGAGLSDSLKGLNSGWPHRAFRRGLKHGASHQTNMFPTKGSARPKSEVRLRMPRCGPEVDHSVKDQEGMTRCDRSFFEPACVQ